MYLVPHFTDEFAKKEEIQLAEEEQCKRENEEPHRPELVKNSHHDV